MISAMVWDASGVGDRNKINVVRNILRLHPPMLLVILEPKLPNIKLANFARKVKYYSFVHSYDTNHHIW